MQAFLPSSFVCDLIAKQGKCLVQVTQIDIKLVHSEKISDVVINTLWSSISYPK